MHTKGPVGRREIKTGPHKEVRVLTVRREGAEHIGRATYINASARRPIFGEGLWGVGPGLWGLPRTSLLGT
jgi:hypothetical protein